MSQVLDRRWSSDTNYDEVMLLVADLLDAHADTGIEMETWPRALEVVTSHLSRDADGQALLRTARITPWFTVIGTHHHGAREVIAIVPGRQHLDIAVGAWQRQVRATTAADAVRLTTDPDEPLRLAQPAKGSGSMPRTPTSAR